RVRGCGLGRVVAHPPGLADVSSRSGGYPGYGSSLLWHGGAGCGGVALANSKYAPVTPLAMKTLRLLPRELPDLLARRPLQAAARTPEAAGAALTRPREGEDPGGDAWVAANLAPDISRPEGRPLKAAARTLEAAEAALTWLREGDDAVADAWFADNMDPDISRQERRRRLTAALTAAGLDHAALAGLRAEGAEVLSRARLRWTVPGRGAGAPSLRIEMLMDPRR